MLSEATRDDRAWPLASVVVCVRNRPEQILDCLRALSVCDYAPLEIVVVDDASTDRTPEVVRDFAAQQRPGAPEIRVVCLAKNLGVSGARNEGIAAARGEVVLFTDSDCVVQPAWPRAMVRQLQDQQADAACGVVYDRAPRNLAERAFFGNTTLVRCRWRGRTLVGNNMGFRRETLARFTFDPLLNYYCDEDDLARRLLASAGKIAFADDAVVEHRHGLNFAGYVRAAYKQGQGSARYWFKHERYVGRDVFFSVLAWLSLPMWLIDVRFALVTAICVALQLAALLFNEVAFKGASWGWSLAVLPLLCLHNLIKSATVLGTLVRIAIGREPLAWQSRRAWQVQRASGAASS